MIKLTPKQTEVYTLIYNNPDISTRDILAFFDLTRSTLKEHMEKLKRNGLIKYKVIDGHGTRAWRVDKRIKICV